MYAFHHVALSVSNLKKSIAFYELFGFRKVGSWEPEDGAYKIINLRCGEMMLELFCYKNTAQGDATDLWRDLPSVGVKHFGLQVASIDEAKQILQKKGLEILYEEVNEDRSGANYFFVRDPDSILVEIIEDNRGY